MIRLLHGRCEHLLQNIPDKSVRLVLTDPPYGMISSKWDTLISFDLIWTELPRIITSDGAIVLFAAEPFTSLLIMSNLDMFRYRLTWVKNKPTGFLQAKVAPLRYTEDVVVFSPASASSTAKNKMVYNPQGLIKLSTPKQYVYDGREHYEGKRGGVHRELTQYYTNYPKNVLYYDTENGFHPTQKPVALLEYLIQTYSDEGDLVLDYTAGSFSTAIAAIRTKRRFIGFEADERYFNIGQKRVLTELEGESL